jgi:hypothetical protein
MYDPLARRGPQQVPLPARQRGSVSEVNKAQAHKSRMIRLHEIGCIACRMRGRWREVTIHHRNLDDHAGQKRLGDECTIPLCTWHHQGYPAPNMTRDQTREWLGPSMAQEPNRFREVFGTGPELQARTNNLVEAFSHRAAG